MQGDNFNPRLLLCVGVIKNLKWGGRKDHAPWAWINFHYDPAIHLKGGKDFKHQQLFDDPWKTLAII